MPYVWPKPGVFTVFAQNTIIRLEHNQNTIIRLTRHSNCGSDTHRNPWCTLQQRNKMVESSVPSAPAGQSGPEVLKIGTARYTSWPDALKAARNLRSKNSLKDDSFWKCTDLVVEPETSRFVVRCAGCKKECSLSNPSRFWKEHNCRQKGQAGSEFVKGEDPGALALKKRKGQDAGELRSFALASAQCENFKRLLVKAIVTANIPFTFVENESLLEACKHVGITELPSRQQLADKYVPALAAEATLATKATVSTALYVDASSDGWRKKYCQLGAPLMNVVALLLDQSLFHNAEDCSDRQKSAEGIEKFLIESSKSLVGDSDTDLERVAGWVLDNTKANWSAMKSLNEPDKHPKWIMRGCFAHALNLLMKDFCKFKAATGPNARERTFGLRWAEDTVKKANKVANFVSDSGAAKNLVRNTVMITLHNSCTAVKVVTEHFLFRTSQFCIHSHAMDALFKSECTSLCCKPYAIEPRALLTQIPSRR